MTYQGWLDELAESFAADTGRVLGEDTIVGGVLDIDDLSGFFVGKADMGIVEESFQLLPSHRLDHSLRSARFLALGNPAQAAVDKVLGVVEWARATKSIETTNFRTLLDRVVAGPATVSRSAAGEAMAQVLIAFRVINQ